MMKESQDYEKWDGLGQRSHSSLRCTTYLMKTRWLDLLEWQTPNNNSTRGKLEMAKKMLFGSPKLLTILVINNRLFDMIACNHNDYDTKMSK